MKFPPQLVLVEANKLLKLVSATEMFVPFADGVTVNAEF